MKHIIAQTLTRDALYGAYVTEGLSIKGLERRFGFSGVTIIKYMRKFGIESRPWSTKGMQPRLGAVLTEETKEKIRQKHLGKKLSSEHKASISRWNQEHGNPFKGRHHSEESKEKQRAKMKGRELTPEHRVKIIRSLVNTWLNPKRGAEHPNWKGGISPINARIRQGKEHQLWVRSVKERDNYTCVLCGHYSLSNHADHIKSFSAYPELRTSIENGRTLCIDCHRKTDNFAGRGNKKITT